MIIADFFHPLQTHRLTGVFNVVGVVD